MSLWTRIFGERLDRPPQLKGVGEFDESRLPFVLPDDAPLGLRRAAAYWNDIFNKEVFQFGSPEDYGTWVPVLASDKTKHARADLRIVGGKITSCAISVNYDRVKSFIRDHFAPWDRSMMWMKLFAHELGHVLGLRHTRKGMNLMHPKQSILSGLYLSRKQRKYLRVK